MARRQWSIGSWVGGVVSATLLAVGCGSGDNAGPSGGYYLHFQTPGGQVSFAVQGSLLAAFAQSGSQYTMLATGIDPTSNFSLTVFDGAAITEKQYSGYGINQSLGAVVGVLLTYQDVNGVVWGAGSGAINHRVTITHLTSTTVTGTFDGTMKAAGHPDLQISGGEFYVARAN